MANLSIGDLALTFNNRHHNLRLKQKLAQLGEELASGQKADISTIAGGDFAPVVGIERALKANAAFSTTTAEAGDFARTTQAALGSVQAYSAELGTTLLATSPVDHPATIMAATADTKAKFQAVVALFNTQSAGRHVFSGTATDRPALADSQTILGALQSAVAGQTTAAGVEAAVNTWFDTPGGGFDTLAYNGSTTTLAAFRLSDTDSVQPGVTAADPEVRSVLKAFAVAALVGTGTLAGNATEQAALTQRAGEMLLSADGKLSYLRANVGTAEALIDEVSTRNTAEKSALEIARNKITAVDPYRIATDLEAVQTQLETLYRLTVRMSRLSLAEYL